MIAIASLKYQIKYYHRKVTTLHATNRTYHEMTNVQSVSKNPLDFNGCPEGRNTIHCKRYKLEWFKERFLISYIYCLLSSYLGVFIKVYIFDFFKLDELEYGFKMTWVYASIISFAPIFLMYTSEILKESMIGQSNFNKKKDMILNFMSLAINKQE